MSGKLLIKDRKLCVNNPDLTICGDVGCICDAPNLGPYVVEFFDLIDTDTGPLEPGAATRRLTRQQLWHNMRASRLTEFYNEFPAHIVSEWAGNNERMPKIIICRSQKTTSEERSKKVIKRAPAPRVSMCHRVSANLGSSVKNATNHLVT